MDADRKVIIERTALILLALVQDWLKTCSAVLQPSNDYNMDVTAS